VLDNSLQNEQQIVGNARRSIIEVTGSPECQLYGVDARLVWGNRAIACRYAEMTVIACRLAATG